LQNKNDLYYFLQESIPFAQPESQRVTLLPHANPH